MTDTIQAVGCVRRTDQSAGFGPSVPCMTRAGDQIAWIDIPASAVTTECPEDHMCSIPVLSFEDGVAIAGAIGGVWAIGLVARLLIRAQQNAMRDP